MIYKLLYLSGVDICSIFDNSCEDLMCSGIMPDAATLETMKRTITLGGSANNKINANALKNNANTMKRKGPGNKRRTMKRKGPGNKRRTMKRKGPGRRTMKKQ